MIMPIGELAWETTGTLYDTAATTGTYKYITPTNARVLTNSQYWTQSSDGILKWTGPPTMMHTAVSISFKARDTSNFELAIGIDGSVTPLQYSKYSFTGTGLDAFVTTAFHVVLYLATNQTFGVLIQALTGGNPTIDVSTFNVVAVNARMESY